MTKSLKEKAIDIKGKKYVQVSDRILYFNETYPNGSIETKLVSAPGADMVIVKAKVTPDLEKPIRYFTGYSQAVWGDGVVNKTAALENCETSAVGRALGMMGIGVLESVASADEVYKATRDPRASSTSTTISQDNVTTENTASPAQIKYVGGLQKDGKVDTTINPLNLTKQQASEIINKAVGQNG